MLMGLSCLAALAQIQPVSRTVTVVGAAKNPGVYPMRDTGLTLLQVIGMSEGFLPTARKSAIRIVRLPQGTDDRLLEAIVNFEKIMVGEAPDVQLQSGDVIFVPSYAKPSGPPHRIPPAKDIAKVLFKP
jgi:protein involved in polysaccharide export with SLBB domain